MILSVVKLRSVNVGVQCNIKLAENVDNLGLDCVGRRRLKWTLD